MDDLEEHKEDLQSHYDSHKQRIAVGSEEYSENFAAITDALGIAHFKSDPNKALSLLQEALEIRRDKICEGKDDESVITSLNNVCILLRKMNVGRDAEAIDKYQREAVEMFCRLYHDSRHLNAAANLNSLVDIMIQNKIGDLDKDFIRYTEMAVDRFRKYFSANEEKVKEQQQQQQTEEQQQQQQQEGENDDNSENQQEEKRPAPVVEPLSPTDPLFLHYCSTLKKLAGFLKSSSTRSGEAEKYFLEAQQIEARFEEAEKKMKEDQ